MNILRRKTCIRRGFTLLESLMAMGILSFAAAGVLLPFASGASIRTEAARITIASKLAGDLLEEICVSSSSPGSWNGFSESAGSLTDYAGNIMGDSAYSGLSRSVVSLDASLNNDVYWVTVTVKYQGNDVVSLSRLVSG